MRTQLLILSIFLGLVNFQIRASSPKIIIKLDDLMALKGECTAKATMDFLISNKVKFTYGVIANRIDETSYKTLAPYINAVDSNGENLLEIWHHGYDHVIPEFRDRSYEYQKQHFEEADKRVKELLNIQMHTFGAPGNATDSVTPLVISENPNYRVFMLGYGYNQKYDNLQHWMQRVEMENGTGNVNYDYFLTNYNKFKNTFKNYMIFQGHPNGWDDNKLNEFKKIINYLKKDSCEFILPYDEYCKYNLNSPINLQGSFDKENKKVILKWIDSNDLKVDYNVQRSDDSIKWTSIGRVYSSGKTKQFGNDTLVCEDKNFSIKYGAEFYRVKLNTGANSKKTNTATVIIDVDTQIVDIELNKSKIKVYPNPCKRLTNIEFFQQEEGVVDGLICDLDGRVVYPLFKQIFNAGINKKDINVGKLNPGIYIIKLNLTGGKYLTSKLIIDSK